MCIVIAVALLALVLPAAFASPSMVEGAAKIALVAPIIFYAIWRAVWGWKRNKGPFEHISPAEPPPSATERWAALSWLLFRRFVCGLGGLAFGVYAAHLFLQHEFFLGTFMVFVALGVIWHGVIGGSADGRGSLPGTIYGRTAKGSEGMAGGGNALASNSASLTDAFSSLRCACGAAKRER